MSQEPRLRSRGRATRGPYPLGQIPDTVLVDIGRQIVHRVALGMADIPGDDFGTIFAEATGGVHRASPVGLSDVEWNGTAWSAKTVKAVNPFQAKQVRVISGRNSPDYSFGMEEVRKNLDATGRAVLAIWNARVNQGRDEHEDLRVVVLVRNITTREFVVFEEETQRFAPGDYTWRLNKRNNLEGIDKATGEHRFTWQPSGGQFTIKRTIPGSARRFSIGRAIPILDPTAILTWAKYRPDWVRIWK